MAKQYYIDENGNAIPVSGTINTAQMLPLTSSPTSPTTADAIGAKLDKTSGVCVATYSFNKSINATTEATFSITRTDFDLPTGAKVVDGYIKQNNSVNTSNYWAYACVTNPTSSTAMQGAIYNPTNSNRNYPVMATVFYTLA